MSRRVRSLCLPTPSRVHKALLHRERRPVQPRPELERGARLASHCDPPPSRGGGAARGRAALGSGAAFRQRPESLLRPIGDDGPVGMFRGALAGRCCLVRRMRSTRGRPCRTGSSPTPSLGATRRRSRLPGWKDPSDDILRTFTILATATDDDMEQLYDRMPGDPGGCGFAAQAG